MPTASDGSVMGDNCKTYYSATLGGAGVLTEIPVIIDDTVSSERRTAESNCRGDTEVKTHVGKPKHSLSGSMLHKRGTPGTAYLAMKTAYMANTTLHFVLATGTVTDTAEHAFRMEGKFSKWEESRAENDSVKVSFEIQPDPSSSYASNYAVT